MTQKQRKALMRAAEFIATKKQSCICHALLDDINLEDIEESKMINPGTTLWWGVETMNVPFDSFSARNARLIGIAMMLTMPKSMIK